MSDDMTHSTHNYFAHGGGELVIGGRLTLLPNAVIDDEAGVLSSGGKTTAFQPLPAMPDSDATTVAALREDLNTLLKALRDAGLMVTAE